METFFSQLNQGMELATDVIWQYVLVTFLLIVGVFFTVISRFIQFRYMKQMFSIFKKSFSREKDSISSFQALILSISGRVGAGNIAGVAVAIALGGPGAVFWMWCTALLGMATSFFECTLAQAYKHKSTTEGEEGIFKGGPAFYIRHGLGSKWLAWLYSAALLLSFGISFTAVQSYTVAASLQTSFHVPPLWTAIGFAVVLSGIIFGGLKRIVTAAEILVPFMIFIYFSFSIVFLLIHISSVPHVFSEIFTYAFGLKSIAGGSLGATIMYGVRRGLFANEAGLGSAPNVAATAAVKHPFEQGVVQSLSVFIDSFVVCTCTAFLILFSDVYNVADVAQAHIDGAILTQKAVASQFGSLGGALISLSLTLFAFTTIMYDYILGESALFAFGITKKMHLQIYRVIVVMLAVWGSMQNLETVFGFADLTMGLLAVANLIAISLLAFKTIKIIKNYEEQRSQGVKEPLFTSGSVKELELDRFDGWPADAADLPKESVTVH